jgi:hypothetical protein
MLQPMTDNVVISEVDARMYVVLSKEKKHFFFMGSYLVPQNVWRYSRGVWLPEVVITDFSCILFLLFVLHGTTLRYECMCFVTLNCYNDLILFHNQLVPAYIHCTRAGRSYIGTPDDSALMDYLLVHWYVYNKAIGMEGMGLTAENVWQSYC